MKKLSKIAIASILTLGSMGIIAVTHAKPYGDGTGPCMRDNYKQDAGWKQGGRGFNIDRMAQRLNLTEEQRTQVESIVNDSKQEMMELRNAMQENRKQIRELIQQSEFNEPEVRKIADVQGDLKTEMIVLRAQQRSQIHAILSEEQREQMNKMRNKKRG